MRPSATSRSCSRRPEAGGPKAGIALHLLRSRTAPSGGVLGRAAVRGAARECVRRMWEPAVAGPAVRIARDHTGVPWAFVVGLQIPLSLSHAGGYAAAAAHPALRVGVDVEPLRALSPELSRYFLSLEEVDAMRPWEDAATAPLAAWTVKEAVLKAAGLGLSIPPKSVTIRCLGPGGRVGVAFPGADVAAACWLQDGAAMAVACVGTPRLPEIRMSEAVV